MMRAKYIASILLIATLCVACDKEQPATSNESGEEGTLTLTTRSTDGVDNFANSSTLRLAIYESGTEELTPYLSEDYGDIYTDIYMKKSSSVWSYSFNGGTSSYSKIVFFKDEDGGAIDIVATYPYTSSEDLSAVSFSIATQSSSYNLGYMWAKSSNNSLNTSELTADLYFQHIMSALNLAISTKNSSGNVTLQYVTLTLTDAEDNPKASIIPSGTINFFDDGKLTTDPETYVDTQAIYMNYTLYTTTSYYYADRVIYLPPFEMDADDKLNISFKIDGVYINESIDLTGKQFEHSSSTTGYGFERGCKYTLNIVLDNYLKFEGSIIKDDTWSDGDTTSTDV